MLDGDDILFDIGGDTVKARNIRRDERVSIVVDDETYPYAFVMSEGPASLSDDLEALRHWATRIGAHYADESRASCSSASPRPKPSAKPASRIDAASFELGAGRVIGLRPKSVPGPEGGCRIIPAIGQWSCPERTALKYGAIHVNALPGLRIGGPPIPGFNLHTP